MKLVSVLFSAGPRIFLSTFFSSDTFSLGSSPSFFYTYEMRSKIICLVGRLLDRRWEEIH